MAGIILCIFAVVIITIAIVVVKLGVEILKDIGWWKNFTWQWPRSHKDDEFDKQVPKGSCDIEGALDRLHERELQFQQEEAAKKKAASRPSISKFVNTRITLQDVHDYVERCPPLWQTAQCTGCHIACKDGCDHTCNGKCSSACNNSCHFACVGVCGGGCSGEATAIGVNAF